jgi:hypothetical protein
MQLILAAARSRAALVDARSKDPKAVQLLALVFDDVGEHPGRGGHDPLVYAWAAALYVEACKRKPNAPIQYMDMTLTANGAFITERQLRRLVDEAARRGLLVGRRPRRPAGRLSVGCKRMLQAAYPEGSPARKSAMTHAVSAFENRDLSPEIDRRDRDNRRPQSSPTRR